MAVALKVPVQKLEALEADRIDLLPDAVFARALASSICRALKLDPSEVLRLLPASTAPSLEFAARPAAATVPARLSDPGKSRSSRGITRVSRPVVIGALLLVVAAAALLVYPAFVDPETAGEEVVALPPSTGDASPPAGTVVESTGAPLLSPALEPAPAASAAVTPPAPATSAAAAPAALPATPPASAAAAASASDVLHITARSASWVQVTDAGGTTTLRRTLADGESVAVPGSPPLTVVVGRADAVEVVVRGAAFDIGSVARNNIARFQVK